MNAKRKSLAGEDLSALLWRLVPFRRALARRARSFPRPPWLRRLARVLKRAGYSVRLLAGGRVWVYLLADAVLLLFGLSEALLEGGRVDQLYWPLVLIPNLAFGVPLMAALVALERRAGSLDLALAVPRTVSYFLRRLLPPVALLVAQSWLVLTLASGAGLGMRLRGMMQAAGVSLVLAAAVLFWAVRLRSAGAVTVATWLTSALLSKWLFFQPFERFLFSVAPNFLGVPKPVLEWLASSLVLALAAALMFLYARQRMLRPESLLDG